MGRLTLNMLLSFAQFEREVAGERIRDKIAASRKKGMWMGGWAPFGYEVKDRKLVIVEKDADIVRGIFRRFVQLRSATTLAKELAVSGTKNRYGHRLDKGSQASEQSRLRRRGRSQGHGLSRRARCHRRSKALGQSSFHPEGEPSQTGS
jgi:DNA invertase Pin-like site-specific DNA recombinase